MKGGNAMSINDGKLNLTSNDVVRLRNKAISLGLINPRDCGRSAVEKLRKAITTLALAELKTA